MAVVHANASKYGRMTRLAVECKWSVDEFEVVGMAAFRRQYPQGENVVVAQDVQRSFVRHHGDLKVHFESLPSLMLWIEGEAAT